MPTAKKPKTKQGINPRVDTQALVAVSDFLKQASEPIRVRILLMLLDGERNVGSMCEEMSYQQSAVSHQLRLMRHGGLLSTKRVGKNVFYNLTESGKSLANVVRRVVDP